jgi:hypothetical protein
MACLLNHIHRPERADQHASFATNTVRGHYLNAMIASDDGAVRTGVFTGRIFTLMAQDWGADGKAFHYAQARMELLWRNGAGIIIGAVRHHTGNFTGAATNALRHIGDYKSVHLLSWPPRL